MAGYIGTINVSDGLGDVKVTSKDLTKYIVEQQGNSFEVTAVSGLIESNSEVAEIKKTAKKDTKVNKGTITVKSLKNCSSILWDDLNFDEKLDYKDIMILLDVVKDGSSPENFELYDINEDGEIGAIYDGNLNGMIDVSDITSLKAIIMTENFDEETTARWDFDFSGKIENEGSDDINDTSTDVGDILILKNAILDERKPTGETKNICLTKWVNEDAEGSSDIIEFKITLAPENVDVPDTALDAPIWFYVVGAVFMAFGIYLIVESKKLKKEQ